MKGVMGACKRREGQGDLLWRGECMFCMRSSTQKCLVSHPEITMALVGKAVTLTHRLYLMYYHRSCSRLILFALPLKGNF